MRCEQYLLGEHAASGLPATVLRVAHTLGPMSPLASRDPVFFARLEAGRPIFVPGEGFPFVHLVHVADVAALMASIAGNERCRRADLQRRRRRDHQHPRAPCR